MLTWLGDDALTLDDLAFRITFPRPTDESPIPDRFSRNTFLIAKPRSLLEQYVALMEELQPQRVVELGILRGGSTVLLSTLAKPEKYVAIDLVDQSTASFGEWLRGDVRQGHVVAYFGIDQADGKTLRNIATKEFGGESLDLVIDDASHLFAPTKTSFETLFPYLRPGGVYVIEDWATQHQFEKAFRDEMNSGPAARARIEGHLREHSASWAEKREPLTRLLVQIVLAAAYTDIIDDIRVRPGSVMIRRGPEDFDQTGFALSNFYLDLGRELLGEEPKGNTETVAAGRGDR